MTKNIDEKIIDVLKNIAFINNVDMVGKPVSLNDQTMIIPIYKTTLLFGEVKSHLPFDKNNLKKSDLLFEASEDIYPHGGGNIGNIKTEPCAVLLIQNNEIKFLKMEENNTFLKILDIVKDFIKKK